MSAEYPTDFKSSLQILNSQIFGWSDGVRFRTKNLSSTNTDNEHWATWVDFGLLMKLFAITTCRKTATTACHVAGFLREQAIPIPIPPILMIAFSSLSPVHVAHVDVRDESRAGPSLGNGGVTLKIHRSNPALCTWYFRQSSRQHVGQKERRWCFDVGCSGATAATCHQPPGATDHHPRLLLCPELTSGALSTAANNVWRETLLKSQFSVGFFRMGLYWAYYGLIR